MSKAKALGETDWLTCREPYRLLRHLQQHVGISRLPGSTRRLRLFAVACCRRAWPLLADPRSRAAVEVAEQFADGGARRAELAEANAAARDVEHAANQAFARFRKDCPNAPQSDWLPLHRERVITSSPVWTSDSGMRLRAVQLVASQIAHAVTVESFGAAAKVTAQREDEEVAQCSLIRDIFGNPFQPEPVFDEAWLTWHDSIVANMARAIYDGHAFDRMPLLADALEEAGCTDVDILGHCRSGIPHARGCWLIDALLGGT